MSDSNTKRTSLAELRQLKEKGEIFHAIDALSVESLGADFWAKATLELPKKTRSVHLKLDQEVFDFFYAETNGKGHLTRMQAVLKAYMRVHQRMPKDLPMPPYDYQEVRTQTYTIKNPSPQSQPTEDDEAVGRIIHGCYVDDNGQ